MAQAVKQVSFKGCICLVLTLWREITFVLAYGSVYPQKKWMISVSTYSVTLYVCIWFCLSFELGLH